MFILDKAQKPVKKRMKSPKIRPESFNTFGIAKEPAPRAVETRAKTEAWIVPALKYFIRRCHQLRLSSKG